jgi:adenylate kinase family enzyme
VRPRYNIHSQKPCVTGICDDCQVALVQRRRRQGGDDSQAFANLQGEQTEPLIAYYRERGLLIDADNEGTIERASNGPPLLDDRLGRA